MPNVAWEPGDDICPPWWPGWWRRKNWPPPPPRGFEKFEQIHLTLAIHEMAGQLGSKQLGREIQTLTSSALRDQVEGIE